MSRDYRKYSNHKTVLDGIQFDSKLEAQRYAELKLLERAGKIKDLQLQPGFELIPSFKKNGKTYKGCKYIADFRYYDVDRGVVIVEDAKGYETEVYKIKRKLFEWLYPELTITEIRR